MNCPFNVIYWCFVNDTNPRCEHLTAHCWNQGLCFPITLNWVILVVFFLKLRHFYVCFGYVHAFCMVFNVWQNPSKDLILPKANKSIKMTNVVPRLLYRVWFSVMSSCACLVPRDFSFGWFVLLVFAPPSLLVTFGRFLTCLFCFSWVFFFF